MTLKIGVMGAGAIGCFVGGKLADAGEDVVLVARGRTLAELSANDLTMVDLDGARSVVAKGRAVVRDHASALADRDMVLVCVKSGQTADVGRDLAKVLSPGAVVASFQNGVRNADALRAGLGAREVLGAIVGFNVVAEGGGVYRRATTGPLVLEGSTDARVGALVRSLVTAGFEARLAKDIRAQQYTKLLMNLNNAVSALTGAPTRDLVFVSSYRRILAAVMGEALAVFRRAKIRPARLGPLPPHVFPIALRLPTPLVRVVARAQLKIDPTARSSMWQDLAAGRLTEVDELNGEIVRLADGCGATAPLNARLVALVHEAERAGKGSPGTSGEELWRALTL
jgi:2-dehydropantoate 2-reductase